MKNISILGSTGSIGTQVLDVVRSLEGIKVSAITSNTNIRLMEQQIREFKPNIAVMFDTDTANLLKERVKDTGVKILSGMDGLIEAAADPDTDLAVIAVVGMIGLIPTIEAIKSKKDIALATKEVLVAAGDLVMNLARQYGVDILPIDSEHSAIMQCLEGNSKKEIERIILTASGGPFRGKVVEELEDVTVGQALAHPNWEMGSKITIDSATLMNKGLEVIEARWLFDISPEKIDVVVHPQSVIHSMVEYVDGSVIAQLGAADMRIPIQYALTYPKRVESTGERLNLLNKDLTFEKPDYSSFKALGLAYKALNIGGTMTTVLNSSNEAAVDLFLKNKISFLDIPHAVEESMNNHKLLEKPNLDDILSADTWSREFVQNMVH